MVYYVYELRDPRNCKPFYVGKGKGARISQHELDARRGRVSRKCDFIREIERAGLRVDRVKVRTFSDEQDAYDYEAELICHYGLENLTNVVYGGGAARLGASVYHDRMTVKWAAEILNRTQGRKIKALIVLGERLDLTKIVDGYIERVAQTINRRGLHFVNQIAARYSVSFTYG